MFALLGLILPLVPNVLMGWLKERGKLDNRLIDAEMQRRELIAQVTIAQYEHWIAWLPRFLIEMGVAAYVLDVFITSMLHIPKWGPLKMPPDFVWVLMTVIGGMFFTSIARKFLR